MDEYVLLEEMDGVLVVTLNRPDKKNALTRAMYAALAAALQRADERADLRCVLLLSRGDSFTAGNDLADFAAVNAATDMPHDDNPFIRALALSRTPIVAAVQGKAVGIGVTLLLHCDLVYLASDASLITPFVNLALVPEAASSALLPQRIGHVRAFEMFVLGQPVSAQQALAWGLANAVVPLAQLHEHAADAARAVAARPAAAVCATKELMRDAAPMLERMQAENVHFIAQLKSSEFGAALRAHLTRRLGKAV